MEMEEIRQKGLRNNKKIWKAIQTILEEIGENPSREGLQRTPYRYAKACEEWFGGYGKDPRDILDRTFSKEKYSGIVLVKDIICYSHCEHHITPMILKLHIGYIPNKHITGLDKIPKLAEIYARRLQNQERLTDQIADAMYRILKCKGVMVICEGTHFCMCSRGVRQQDSKTVTSSIRGVFKNKSARDEFLALVRKDE